MSPRNPGFVYVLLNMSFDDQVKIGRTDKEVDLRASQLWTTGVPTPFIVVYDELVSDSREVEARLQRRFAGYRVNAAREFFRVPVREAIRALQEEAGPFKIGLPALANRVEILEPLKVKYPTYLKPDIISVAIVQPPGISFLEVTRRTYPHSLDEISERVDLSFIAGEVGDMFPPTDPVEVNAARFVNDFDAYSIIMTTPLFSDEGAREVAEEWEQPGGQLERKRRQT